MVPLTGGIQRNQIHRGRKQDGGRQRRGQGVSV